MSGGHITTTAGPDWASHTIATVKNDGPDARLIAAAPDMYKALLVSERYVAKMVADKIECAMPCSHALKIIRHALARAGGEESND